MTDNDRTIEQDKTRVLAAIIKACPRKTRAPSLFLATVLLTLCSCPTHADVAAIKANPFAEPGSIAVGASLHQTGC